MTPSYARIAHAPDELRQAFRKVLGFCALVSISTSLGLGAVADDFVKVVLGDQWLDSIPFFKWLTVFAAIHGVTLTVVPYLNINHRERALGLSWLGYALVFMPVLAAVGLMTADLEQIAIARTLLALGFCIWIFSYISLYTPATASDIIQELWRPVLAGAAMVFAVRASHDPSIALPVLSLMRDIIVGASVFGVVLCALWMLAGKPSGAESFILNRLFEKVKGKSST